MYMIDEEAVWKFKNDGKSFKSIYGMFHVYPAKPKSCIGCTFYKWGMCEIGFKPKSICFPIKATIHWTVRDEIIAYIRSHFIKKEEIWDYQRLKTRPEPYVY